MDEEGSDSGVESNIASEHMHINSILDYVLLQRYPPGCSKIIKRDIKPNANPGVHDKEIILLNNISDHFEPVIYNV